MVRSGVRAVRSGACHSALLGCAELVVSLRLTQSYVTKRGTSCSVESLTSLILDSLQPTTTFMCSSSIDNNFTTSSLKVLVTS